MILNHIIRHRYVKSSLLLLLSSLAIRSSIFAADSPLFIPFQGQVTNQAGTIVADGQYSVIFNLYDQAVGGQPIWSERHVRIGVTRGTVNVFLGSISPLTNVNFAQTKYLGITVDTDNLATTADPEMVPRSLIIPAFHAKTAENAQESAKLAGHDWSSILVGGSNNPSTGQIAAAKLETNGITANQIAPSAVNASAIATDAVRSAEIDDGTIQDADIGTVSRLDAADGNPQRVIETMNNGAILVNQNMGFGTASPQDDIHIFDGSIRMENPDSDFWLISAESNDLLEILYRGASQPNFALNSQSNPFTALIYYDGAAGSATVGLLIDDTSTSADTTDSLLTLQYRNDSDVTGSQFATFRDSGGTIGKIAANADSVSYLTTSDRRLKAQIEDYHGGLEVLAKLRPRSFKWKSSGAADVGVIAQELAEILPDAVSGSPNGDPEKEPMMVSYDSLVPILISAVQELSSEVELLKKQLRDAETQEIRGPVKH